MTDLMNLMQQFLLHWVICVGGKFCCYTIFEKKLNFWCFLSVPHLVDIYAKNVDERGRNFMCERTLTSLLVQFSSQVDLFSRVSDEKLFCCRTAGNAAVASMGWVSSVISVLFSRNGWRVSSLSIRDLIISCFLSVHLWPVGCFFYWWDLTTSVPSFGIIPFCRWRRDVLFLYSFFVDL